MGKETVQSVEIFTSCKECGRVFREDWSTRDTCPNCGFTGKGPHYAKEPWCERFKMEIRVMDEDEMD